MTQTSTDSGIANDWPTLALLVLCYGAFAAASLWLPTWAAVPVLSLLIALHASLQHEAIHGHPFRSTQLNTLVVGPCLNLAVPYLRFRDTHLAHHYDVNLTDPYDDPETNYIDPLVWGRMSAPLRWIMRINNTLLGRLLLGPAIGQITFMRHDMRLILRGNRDVLRGWLWHLPAMGVVLAWVWITPLSLGAYLLAAYLGLAILKLRTFLEHQAHVSARGRTVVIEDRGLFALLFLNNNYHAVHHIHPRVAWFRLPAKFRAGRATYLARNHGYYYRSYLHVIARHLLRAKDPVPHPIWRGDERTSPPPNT